MGQARQECPLCMRAPGEVHDVRCARSAHNMKRVQIAMSILASPRLRYPGKGRVRLETPNGPIHTENPGFPVVKPPKPFWAGGLPRGMSRVEAAEHPFLKGRAPGLAKRMKGAMKKRARQIAERLREQGVEEQFVVPEAPPTERKKVRGGKN